MSAQVFAILGTICLSSLFASDHAAKDLPCASCHKKQMDSYYGHNGKPGNTMARALYIANSPEVLQSMSKLEFRLGKFAYKLERLERDLNYSVTDGKERLEFKLVYAFGHGAAGQTYVYQDKGQWFESRLSFFKETGALDLTLGAPPGEPKNLQEAAGREMTTKDVTGCFACHTTNSISNGRVDFQNLQSGIGCGNCHAGSDRHRLSVLSGNTQGAAMTKLSKLTAEEQSETCGRCHRTWADIAANGPRGNGNVRFQPYRLANSKCYDAEDRRIGCVACHDPHSALEKSLATYDSRCTACHSQGSARKICRQSKKDCVSCHMPQVEMPGAHHLFTDHMIRIVRKNEKYPN